MGHRECSRDDPYKTVNWANLKYAFARCNAERLKMIFFTTWWHTSEMNFINMRIDYLNILLIHVSMHHNYLDMQHECP